MPDVYSITTEIDPEVVGTVAEAMELRARDGQQQAMLEDYLTGVDFGGDAAVLEVGCGTGGDRPGPGVSAAGGFGVGG